METSVTEKLRRYRQQLEASKALDIKFGELVGIDFFDFIKQHPQLWQELDRRVRYLNDLAVDKQFNKLQDQLYQKVSAVLKVIGPTRANAAQKWFKGEALYVFPKNSEMGFKTLPQIFEIFLKSENYYRLGDEFPHYDSEKGDMPHAPLHISMIRKQYFDDFETLIKNIRISMKMDNENESIKFKTALEDFYNIRDQLEDKLYAEPLKLHVKDFLDVHHFSMAVRSQAGYREHYDFYNASLYEGRHRPYQFEEIKAACLQVVDDLLEIAAHPDIKDTSKEKIYIDSTRGIYKDGDSSYDISENRRNFVFKLLETELLTADDLSYFWKDSAQATHAVNDINKIFKKRLGVSKELIINSRTAGGYILNRGDFEIISKIAD